MSEEEQVENPAGGENFSKGYQMIKELKDEAKIDSSQFDNYKEKFYKLHSQLETNYANEKSLL